MESVPSRVSRGEVTSYRGKRVDVSYTHRHVHAHIHTHTHTHTHLHNVSSIGTTENKQTKKK